MRRRRKRKRSRVDPQLYFGPHILESEGEEDKEEEEYQPKKGKLMCLILCSHCYF